MRARGGSRWRRSSLAACTSARHDAARDGGSGRGRDGGGRHRRAARARAAGRARGRGAGTGGASAGTAAARRARAGGSGASAGTGGGRAGGGSGGTTVEPAGLIAYWRLNEGSGTHRRRQLAATVRPSRDLAARPGRRRPPGRAVAFDGATGVVGVSRPTAAAVELPDRADVDDGLDKAGRGRARAHGRDRGRAHARGLRLPGLLARSRQRQSPAAPSTTSSGAGPTALAKVPPNTWTHLACTYGLDGAITRLRQRPLAATGNDRPGAAARSRRASWSARPSWRAATCSTTSRARSTTSASEPDARSPAEVRRYLGSSRSRSAGVGAARAARAPPALRSSRAAPRR